ncbi:hypothetical protein [Pontibacter rugosus]|uniref:Uncharacterized protein n=1 Tax=Pontibacter rugosus TaxID=1745966 RepID=A0ABW3SU39_9BACT
MKKSLNIQPEQTLRTECGRSIDHVFRAIKLMRDEKHNFHIIYRTFDDEYIYSFCNPFLETDTITYNIISEAEAKSIFLAKLSEDNARELFEVPSAAATQLSL